MGGRITEESLRGTSTSVIGREIEIIEEAASTNEVARKRAESGCREGLIVLARSQTSGKGRAGRSFVSPPGGLYFSIVLRPGNKADQASILPLMAGLAVSKSISASLMLPSRLKWPNDVLVNDRKVCGILVESSTKGDRLDHVIIGIGINVNFTLKDLPPELSETAGTLMDAKGSRVDMEGLFRDLVCFLEMLYRRFIGGDIAGILDDWTGRSETIGRDVRIASPEGSIEGKALGVDQSGALLLSVNGSLRRISMGDVEHIH
ncbi:MAG: biotin--[acetyl-CoA-carboxylase] ligase [Thermoplasmatota archaeon]